LSNDINEKDSFMIYKVPFPKELNQIKKIFNSNRVIINTTYKDSEPGKMVIKSLHNILE
jgi:hypothetical protein